MEHFDEENRRQEDDGNGDAYQLDVAGDALTRLVKSDEHDKHCQEDQKQRPEERVPKPSLDLAAQPDHRCKAN